VDQLRKLFHHVLGDRSCDKRSYIPRERGAENASSIRVTVIQQLEIFGFKLDPARDAMQGTQSNECITQHGDPIAMLFQLTKSR